MDNTSTEKKSKLSRYSKRFAFPLFLMIIAFSYADQALLSPLLNTLLKYFFNNTENVVPLGYVGFTFTILSAFSMMLFGYLADKSSRKKICFTGTMLYASFSILTYFTPPGETGYWYFFFTRVLNGIGIGAIVPSIYTLVNDSVPASKRTTAFGLLGVGALFGRMLGFLIVGIGLGNEVDWRAIYFTVGLINLILGLLLIGIEEPKRGMHDEELKDVILEGNEYNFKFTKDDLKILLQNKSNLWLILNFIDTIPGSLLMFLIFKYMEDVHNMKVDIVNLIIFSIAIFGALGTVLFGRIGDILYRKDKRAKVFIALFCNIAPIIFVAGFLSLDFWVPEGASLQEILQMKEVIIFLVLISLAIFINQGVGPNWMASVVEVNLPEHRATMIALANFADLLGNALGPLIGSYINTRYSIQAAMWSIMVFWLINVAFWIPVIKNIRNDLNRVHTILKQRADEIREKGNTQR